MPATETLMEAGDWSVNLKADTPRWVRDRIDPARIGWAVFFTTSLHHRPGTISNAGLRAKARYAGLYLDMTDDRHGIGGAGLARLLGEDDDGGTFRLPPEADTPSRDLDEHLDDTMLLDTASTNGITKGAVDNTTGDWVFHLGAGLTRRQMLDTLAAHPSTDRDWLIDTDGVLHVRTPGNLFADSEVCFAAHPARGHGEPTVIPADISIPGTSVRDVISRAVVDWNADTPSTFGDATTTLPYYGLAGDPIENWSYSTWSPRGRKPPVERWRKVAARTVRNETRADNIAAREVAERQIVRDEITVEIDQFDPWRFCRPGDWALVLDRRLGLTGGGTEIAVAGVVQRPVRRRIMSWTVPFPAEAGKYLYHWDPDAADFTLIDITDWVEGEDGPTVIELGFRSRLFNSRVRTRPVPRRLRYRQAHFAARLTKFVRALGR